MAIVPATSLQKKNFHHLYADIFWYGLLAGSTITFLAVYATRIGASAFQISLLTSAPAVINLFFSLPSGRMLGNRPIIRMTYLSAIAFRLGYIILVFLPFILQDHLEVWIIVLTTLFMSVPGTLLAIAFNAMFADIVPPDHRSEVVGKRNALISVSLVGTTLICGQILIRVAPPINYQLVFAIGALGGILSTYHLTRLQSDPSSPPVRVGRPIGDLARPGLLRFSDTLRSAAGLRFLTRAQGAPLLRLDLLRGPFMLFLAAYLVFYTGQSLPVPLFPLAFVRVLYLSDSAISLGTALFHAAVLLISLRLSQISGRYNQKQLLVVSALGYSLYPLLIGLAKNATLYWTASISGGIVWGVAGAALVNRLMEQVPEDHRPAYMALHNIVLNMGILLGALSGPLLGEWLGISQALILAACLRMAAAFLLMKWG